jgi:hypothetical protein
VGQFYEPGGLIWRSRWVTGEAIVECREALALPARTDTAVILRRIEVLEGREQIAVELDLRRDYGRRGPDELRRGDDGAWRARLGDAHALWTGGQAAQADGDQALRLVLDLHEGGAHDLVLVLRRGREPEPVDARRLRSTRAARGGVRRQTAPAARQPAAGIRPRVAARVRRHALDARETVCLRHVTFWTRLGAGTGPFTGVDATPKRIARRRSAAATPGGHSRPRSRASSPDEHGRSELSTPVRRH